MALRFANKIHCIVNNVVAQGLRMQAQALMAAAPPPPKTRYPLNQQDANSYIQDLKTRQFINQNVNPNEHDMVRTLNVEVQLRPKTKDAYQNLVSGNMGLVQRFFSDKKCPPPKSEMGALCGGSPEKKKKKVDCKPPPKNAADGDKCKKMPKDEDEGCPKFKIEKCKPAKETSCQNRKFVFVDCTKPMAPYPSFSEACYEELPPSISHCTVCPFTQENHPTFKPPMNKFQGAMAPAPGKGKGKGGKAGKTQKRKFHSGPSRLVTLRFGEPVKSERDRREEELQKKLYDELNESIFNTKKGLTAQTAPIIKVSPAQTSQAADMFRQLVRLKRLAEVPANINAQRWDMLLNARKGPGFRHQLGRPGKHKMRRRNKAPCSIPPRCPNLKYKYDDYDIKAKQKKYRREQDKKNSKEDDCVCSGVAGGAGTLAQGMQCASRAKGRNMDMHKDMPKHKRQPLGNRRRHKMIKKHKGECEKCEKFKYQPPIIYDVKEKRRAEERRKKKESGGSCMDCSANLNGVDHIFAEVDPKGMWCKMVPKKTKGGKPYDGMECDELAPSEVCPKTLLDRKPYPKYRKAMKERLEKEKEMNEKGKMRKHVKGMIEKKKKKKKSPKKKAAGLGIEEAVEYTEPVASLELPLRVECEQNQPYAIRSHNLVRKRMAELYALAPRVAPPNRARPVPKFDFKPLPEEQCTPPVRFRTELEDEFAHKERVKSEEERMGKTLEKLENMILAKNRIRVVGQPQCGKQECEEQTMKKKTCHKKIKTKICPVDLLDRRPYKKFRDGKKKGKKGKKHRKPLNKKNRGKQASAADDTSLTAMMVMENMTARPPSQQTHV